MPAPVELPKVLIIDDEMGPRESLRMLLKPNYQIFTADNVETGLELLKEKSPDVIVMDIRMPGTSGIEGLRQIREIDAHLSVIMLTGFGALETAQEALRHGANDYINKPFDAVQMRDVIARNVQRTRLQKKGEEAAQEIRELNARLSEELAQKERLASLGQASAEFVHDLSNPLTIVWGYVQILAQKLEQSEKANDKGEKAASPRELNIIEQNVRLCRELLTMWQSYGNGEIRKAKNVSIVKIVHDLAKSMGGFAVQNGVALQCDVSAEDAVVSGDPVQLTRAIQNVMVNAIQAASDRKGSVTVSAERKDMFVDLRVEDTGNGISPEQAEKIFEPYFTTKQGKSGTGLGLYITKKVIEDHRGSIKLESKPGVGTAFTLCLPLSAN
ncbi:MAG: hybrid sensor histidine kinase/response regulator [Verrucomicrobiota bacterium]|nr:hybrid sensor histidine kinase/response regulator [Verrucomicrobiota bacterium]